MTESTRDEEIARYLDGVRTALADLPPQTRDELLDDLAGHLAEIAAEDPTPLTERLGDPHVYAAELRASAGVTGKPTGHRAVLTEKLDRLLALARRADHRIAPKLGYQSAGELMFRLRPGWWVLRGYLVSLLLCDALLGGDTDVIPRVSGSEGVGLILTLGLVALSVWLGRRSTRFPTWPKRGLVTGGVIVALFGAAHLYDVDSNARSMDMNSYVASPTDSVTEVYPYDSSGRPLTGVRLYDQNGNPIDLGWDCTDQRDKPGLGPQVQRNRVPAYPRCDPSAFPVPKVWPAPGVSPSPSPSPGTGVSPSPASEPTPSTTSSASGTPPPSTSPAPTHPASTTGHR